MEDKELYVEKKFLWIIRIGGYLILGGVLIGAFLGVYALLNHQFFSAFINISQYDAIGFFLGVCLPSFIVTVASSYIFITVSDLESIGLWRLTYLSILSVLCLALSALSLFNFLSFVGSLITLTTVILSYIKPTFEAFSRKDACFFTEIGAMFVASFSTLFLLMWFVLKLLPTYSTGLLEANDYQLYTLLIIEVVSFSMFFIIPFLCSRDANTGICGALSLIIGIAISIMILQNMYIFFNASVFLGVFLGGFGIISIIVGGLIYVRLSSSEGVLPDIYEPSFTYGGRYCPYCGVLQTGYNQTLCSRCGRRLMWMPGAPFCPYCGRLIPVDVRTCPHCQETLA